MEWAFVVDQQKVIESLSAQFNNSMLQAVKGEINGFDDSYPSSGMAVYNTTYYFNEASQQGVGMEVRVGKVTILFGITSSKPLGKFFYELKQAKRTILLGAKVNQKNDGNTSKMTSYRGMTSTLFYSNANRQHVMFSRCQSARFQVDPRESNLIAINKIIRYLKGLSTLGVKYPEDIMLNMFGYIDTDYAGYKKDRRSISEAVNLSDRRSTLGSCQLRGRRLISYYDKKQPQIQQLCQNSMTRHLHTRFSLQWHSFDSHEVENPQLLSQTEGFEVNPTALSPTKLKYIKTETTASSHTSSQKDVMAEKALKQLLDSSSQQGASIEIRLSARVLGDDTDPIAIYSSDESNKDGDLRTPIAPPVTSLRMAKVIFLAGTTGFWSYERSDTLVRMSVKMSGEKSEILVSEEQRLKTFRVSEMLNIQYTSATRSISSDAKSDIANSDKKTVNINSDAKSATNGNRKDILVLNSGCSGHMTGNKALLSDFVEKTGPGVSYGDGNMGKTLGYGNINLGNVIIEKVALVSGLKHNLLSVSQICDRGYHVDFFEEHCEVVSKSTGKVVLKGYRHGNIYESKLSTSTDGSAICLLSRASIEESWDWHKKLSHLNFNNINELVKKDLVRGLPKSVFAPDGLCDSCQKAKQRKYSFKSKTESSIIEPYHLLHVDLFGPVMSIAKKKYAMVIVDEFSRYTWVYFLHTKSETVSIFIDHVKHLDKLVKDFVKSIRSDNGTEFKKLIM
ncbi:hypothetical protein AgCh_014106 [Apium graveolens]